jgi:hypothetical protein
LFQLLIFLVSHLVIIDLLIDFSNFKGWPIFLIEKIILKLGNTISLYNVLKDMNMNLFDLIPIIIFNIFNSKNNFFFRYNFNMKMETKWKGKQMIIWNKKNELFYLFILSLFFQVDFVYCHSRYAVIYLYQTTCLTCLTRCLSEWYVIPCLYLYCSSSIYYTTQNNPWICREQNLAWLVSLFYHF